MRKSVFYAPVLALMFGGAAWAQAATPPTKVGIIHIQDAIIRTQDGQKAATELNAKFGPKQREVEKMQSELQALEQQFRSGVNTMSDDLRQKLTRDIDLKRRQLQREMDDAQTELQEEQDRLLQGLGQKMMVVIDKYAKDNGFALILDVSSPQTPVLYASNAIDITEDVVQLYEKGAALPAPAAPAAPETPAPKQPGGAK